MFLDAGGVLVFPNWTRVSDALARRDVSVTPEALGIAEFRAKRRLDLGETISGTDDRQRGWLYFNLTLEEAGIARTPATDAALAELRTYHDRENLWETVPAAVAPTLERLREMGLKLVVVSNANGRLRHLFDRVGLTRMVDVLFDSFEEGVEKPDPRLFGIALDRAGAQRGTTVHVGDLYHVDVAGARAAGITPVLIDSANLYLDCDCLRMQSLREFADGLSRLRV